MRVAHLRRAFARRPTGGGELVYLRTRALVALSLQYGVRLGLLLELELGDVITVTPFRGRWSFKRAVPHVARLEGHALRALRDYLRAAIAAKVITSPNGLLFRNRFGRALSQRNAELDLRSFVDGWTYGVIAARGRASRRRARALPAAASMQSHAFVSSAAVGDR